MQHRQSVKSTNPKCLSCGRDAMSVFYQVHAVPVQSMLLLLNRKEALACAKGDIVLGFCTACGFISNQVFDTGSQKYSSRYEATQAYSPTFNVFHKKLAQNLIERYALRGKNIIEIGCGQGEFLRLICELGENRGVGFDPVYRGDRTAAKQNSNVVFVKDFYSQKYADYDADFICCKMTLEHIHKPAEFVGTIRHTLGDKSETVVFFQVPSVVRILRELAFWDIYYEHCSYFSPVSLARLFQNCGFEILDLWSEYDGQYLMIAAQPGKTDPRVLSQGDDLRQLSEDVRYFRENFTEKLVEWKNKIQNQVHRGKKVVLWGASSKSAAFLTTLDFQKEIEYIVDINPNRQGTYMAGTGQKIVAPQFLQQYIPDVVVLTNPIYTDEIKLDLNRMGLNPNILTF